jgi:hypothetical protein
MTAPAAVALTAGHGLHPSLSPLPSNASLPADRRGRLRNRAEPGDFLAARRCGAHTRAGGCCRQPAMGNGRCRLHGGLSTGPRTPEGRARCARARRIHGFYSAEMITLRRAATVHCRRMDAIFASVKVRRTAGHGLLPPSLSRRTGGSARISPTGPTVSARSTSSASPRLRVKSIGADYTLSAGHGVLSPVPACPLDSTRPRAQSAPRRGLVQRTLLGGTALGLGVTVKPPFSAGHGLLHAFDARRDSPLPRFVETRDR